MIGNNFLLAGGGEQNQVLQFLNSFGDLYHLIDPTDTSSIVLNGGNISQAKNLVSNSLHPSQATTEKQPLYSVGGLNGQNAIYFDGIDDCLVTENYSEGVFTKFWVSNFQSPVGFIEEIRNGQGYSYVFGNNGSSSEVSRVVGSTQVTTSLNAGTGWNLGTKIICQQFDGSFSGHKIWVNGVLVATSTGAGNPGSVPTPAHLTLSLGSRNNGASNWSKGFIGHRSAFNRSFNNTEIGQVFTFLNAKFAVY